MSRIAIEKPTLEDSPRIGALIYTVDPFIYPPLFGSLDVAQATMRSLMSIPNSPFATDCILVARINGDIAGVSVYYEKPFAVLPDLSRFYNSDLPLPESCKDVCERYLLPMCAEVEADDVYLSCIATDERYRKRGVATALIESMMNSTDGKSVSLDVLKSNAGAIALYEKLGFKIIEENEGYASNRPLPKVYRMTAWPQ